LQTVQNLLEAFWIAESLLKSIFTKKWFCPTECGQLQTNTKVISDFIDVLVLPIPASPFTEVVEPPTLENLKDFFYAHPQGHERAHAHIKIGAFSPPHRLFAKIVLHNFWPTVCRNELILKRAQFLYALVIRLPFCLCKHILSIMIESRDEHSTGLPFACLITKLIV
jgi:hypothetical protein